MKYIFCGNSKEKAMSTANLQSEDTFYHLPLTQIKPTSLKMPANKTYEAGVCSSQSVINHLPKLSHLNVRRWFAVGHQTAKLMKEVWKIPNISVPNTYNALSVANMIMESISSGRILWLGAKGGIMSGVDKLTLFDFKLTLYQPYESRTLSVYESAQIWEEQQLSLENFLDQKAVWIFTSPLIAKSYLEQNLHRAKHLICCLGKTTDSIFLKNGLMPDHIAQQGTLKSLFKGVNQMLQGSNSDTLAKMVH